MNKEQLGEIIKLMIIAGFIKEDKAKDLLKSGTLELFGKPINKKFKN